MAISYRIKVYQITLKCPTCRFSDSGNTLPAIVDQRIEDANRNHAVQARGKRCANSRLRSEIYDGWVTVIEAN